MKALLFLFLSMFGTTQVMSQTYFTFTPMVGMQRCFAKYQSGDRPSVFYNNAGNNFFHVGFLLDYHRNRFIYSLGYTQNNAGYAYAIKPDVVNPLDSVINWGFREASANPTNAIEAKVAYSLSEINLFRKKQNTQAFQNSNNIYKDDQHLINFRFNVFGGLLYEHLQHVNFMEYPVNFGHTITQVRHTRLNNNGITGTLGFSIQFLHKGKESLALNFFYHQGFTKLLQMDITYTLINDQVTYHTTLISKGTSFGASISYPIRFWDVDKRKARKTAGS